MSTSLKVLRKENESDRFNRLSFDDHRTSIGQSDARELGTELKKVIDGEVRFDRGSRALYATDGSNYRQAPIGVVIPRSKQDVVETLRLCREFGAPVLSRGGGTSLAGQCCNVAVIMDFTKYMHHVIEIDEKRRVGTCQPGCVLDDFRIAAEKKNLTFGPDPATHNHCAIGGMLGNNSCGIHSLISKNNGFGLRTSDNTHELEIATYDGARFKVGPTSPEELERIIAAGGRRGEIYGQLKQFINKYADEIRKGFPRLERRVSGYNLDDLLPENGFHLARALVGSESTLVTILEATLHLMPYPRERVLIILGYPDVYEATKHLQEILPLKPTGLEGIDQVLLDFEKKKGSESKAIKNLPKGRGFLWVEFGGDSRQEAEESARRCMDMLKKQTDPPDMKLYTDQHEMTEMWEVRESSLGSTAFVPGLPDTWPGWEDSAVPVPQIAPYLRDLKKLFDKFGFHVSTYGHFSQGVVHCRIPFDMYTRKGLDQYHRFMDEASDLVVSYGGSLSGEHGDGQARAMYLPKMFGQKLVDAFAEFKRIWDPQWKMNPGKVVDPYSITDNLRISPDYNPPQPRTYFQYPADNHAFSRATLRCVGVGKCRREGGGTMCPSYMVTREEKHSTRGRARLLFEMMNGELIQDGWREEAVHDALDLCLACKGCKGDCPVNVDMATYKAEFRAHYYEKRIRPRFMYAFGWIHLAAKAAGFAPMVANFFTQTPVLRNISKWLAGASQKRRLPAFAPEPFKKWFAARQPRNQTGQPVVLYADTFNNYFQPDVARAAVEVLEDAGFHVIVPMGDLCCGRPLYDYGFLGMARRWLQDNLQKLRPYIQAQLPMVVLEPGCWSVFADELTNMYPNEMDAKRLQKNVYLLAEFLKHFAPDYQVPKLHRKALLHKHCHHKAELKHVEEAEGELLRKMGIESREPATGCCGMAGAFGYEPGEHYDVSIKCGERILIPEVNKAKDDELIIADGFSCREQIEQMSDRHALHIAQVIQLAKHQDSQSSDERPEAAVVKARKSAYRKAALQAGVPFALGLIAGGILYRSMRTERSRVSILNAFSLR